MSNLTVKGNTSGTGTVILEAPNTNSNRTITLPDATATLASTAYVDSSVATAARMVTGTAVASTSGTAIDFTGIPSWAKRVTVMLNGVSFASNPGVFQMRLGTSSGIDASGGYATSAGNILATSATDSSYSNFNEFYLHDFNGSTSASSLFWGQVVLNKITGDTWAMSGCVGCNSPAFTASLAGTKTLSAALDRIRLFSSGGATFDAGTINIMWEG